MFRKKDVPKPQGPANREMTSEGNKVNKTADKTTLDGVQYRKIEHSDGRIELIPVPVVLSKDWKPTAGEGYFFVGDGHGGAIPSTATKSGLWELRIAHHNVFKTRQEANSASILMARSNAIIRACLLVDPDLKEGNAKWYPLRVTAEWKPFWVVASHTTPSSPAYVGSEKDCKEVCELLTAWGVE